jgi:quinolinate synthase
VISAADVRALARERNAVILAHYYQRPEVQDVADVVGDSLHLAMAAQRTGAEVVVLAGVRFMAETAKLLNPERTVLLPEANAGCSLVEQSPTDAYRAFVEAHDGHAVVTYINSSIDIKAMSDVICTSSNVEQVVNSIPDDTPIVFGPDANLASWVRERTGRTIVAWPGACEVHEAFDRTQIVALKAQHPNAIVLAHSECTPVVREVADVIGSTSRLLHAVMERPDRTYIVATEPGILHRMHAIAPQARLIPAPPIQPTECACSLCPHMRLTTLESIVNALETLSPRIEIDADIAERAARPVRRMMELGAS